MLRIARSGILLIVMIALAACAATPTPTPAPTALPTQTLTPTASPTPSPTPFVYPMRLDVVGQMGGLTTMLALAGKRIYLQVGARVLSVDVSNPAKPTVIGRGPIMEDGVQSLAALGRYALVGDGAGTLWVLDMPETGDLRVVASLEVGNIANDVAVTGQTAFVAAGSGGLVVVDLADPAHPAVITRETVPGSVLGVAVMDNLALVGSDYQQPEQGCDCLNKPAELTIFDVHDPASPVRLSETALQKTDFDRLIAAGDRAYIGDDAYDISDLAHPQYVGGGPRDIDVTTDDYAFSFAERYPNTSPLMLFTVYDRHTGRDVASAIPPLPIDSPAVGRQIIVRGRLAYVAAFNGLAVLDLGVDPGRKFIYTSPPDVYAPDWKLMGWLPTYLGRSQYGLLETPLGQITCGVLYTDSDAWSLEHPEDPRPVDTPLSTGADCAGIQFMLGGYSYVDRSAPAGPVRREVTLEDDGRWPSALRGNLLFMLGPERSTRLAIYDIADPARPRKLAEYTSMPEVGWLDTLTVVGRYAIDNYRYLDGHAQFILDLADPSNPRPVDIPAPMLESSYYASSDDALYVLDENRLKIFGGDDLSAPIATIETPIPPGPSGYPGPQSYVAYVEGRVVIYTFFAETRRSMLTLIDVHDPAHPALLANRGGGYHWAAGYQDYLYLYTWENGILIYELVPD